MNEEKIRELIYDALLIYNQPLTEIKDEKDLFKLAAPLENLNTELFNKIISLINEYQAYDFLRKDREMKIKLEDIWKEECERSRKSIEYSFDEIRTMITSESIEE